MASVASTETLGSYSKTPTYDELFRPTYTFQEHPSPWPAERRGFDTPQYALGWLIRLNRSRARSVPDYDTWSESVVLPRWIELGFENEENVRDGIYPPRVKHYGNHHLLLEIGVNFWKTLSSMKRPEVRERVLHQAWAALELNPKHAKPEKLRWLRYPAPRDTGKKPVTYPAIYKEDIHILPDWYTEMMDGSWIEKYRPKLSPGALSDLEWEGEDRASRRSAMNDSQGEDSDVSDSSGSTTVGPSNL